MITAWGVIALSRQDPIFSRPIWSEIFQPRNVVLQPFSKEETTKGKTPDFKLMKGSELCGYCELKSPRDDWVFEFPDDIKSGESVTEMRPSPTSNNLARQIESAVEQFDAVNPDHKLPNVLVLVNHAVGRTRSDLHVTVTGIQVPDGSRLFTLKPDKQKRVWQAARRVDLFLWVDAQKRTCQHVCPDDAVHRVAVCRLLGIEIGGQDGASGSLPPKPDDPLAVRARPAPAGISTTPGPGADQVSRLIIPLTS